MTITPEQARALLDGATPGPWRALHDQWEDEDGTPCEDFYVLGGPDGILHTEDFDPDTHNPVANTALAAAAPDLAQTIAGMRWEYAVEHEHSPGNWHQVTQWGPEENPYQPGYGPGDDERIIRRLVGPVEVTE